MFEGKVKKQQTLYQTPAYIKQEGFLAISPEVTFNR